MKKSLLWTIILLIALAPAVSSQSKVDLAPDQNPNFAVSRDKYMRMADSLNEWHSTTFQENYKAIDWLADRAQARTDRREFRRQIRLARAQWYDGYYDYYDYYPYRNYRGNYNYRYYNNNYHRYNRGSGWYLNPWGFGYWWR